MELLHFCVSVLLTLVSIQSVSALQCYNCSSLRDERCGVDWKFLADTDAYRVECPVNSTHCFKTVTIPHSMHQEVFRGCWGPWENMTVPREEGCVELGKESETCFCKNSKKACNRDTSLSASVPEIIAGTLFSFMVLFY